MKSFKANELNDQSVQNSTIFKNLYKEFTCTICLQLFKEPVTVSLCKHTYCQECLKQWKVKSGLTNSKTFKCPLCKNETANRSYYLNEKYTIAVKFLIELDSYMAQKRDIDLSKTLTSRNTVRDNILENYLKDCIIYKLDYENDDPEIKVCFNNESLNKSMKERNDLKKKATTDVDSELITDSEENEFILNICSTAENVIIIDKLENDFINDLEKETKKVNNEIATSTPNINKTDSAKKSAWTRLKTINRKIKQTGKYKRLKVTETKSKTDGADKPRTRSSKNKNPVLLDSFDEYLKEKANMCKNKTEKETSVINISSSEKDVIDDDEQNNEDDIFLKSTQILNLDEETTPAPQQIVVNADVHHCNDSVINVPVRTTENVQCEIPTENHNNKNDSIEKCSSQPFVNERKLKNDKTSSEDNLLLLNLSKELKESLEKVSELKSSMLVRLEQNLKESDNLIAEYSNVLYNSDSLFSESIGKKEKREVKANSAPMLDATSTTTKESVTFFNTAIPCVEKIKDYYQRLKVLADQFTQQSTAPSEYTNYCNTGKEVQTDILKCPTCTYTFNLKSREECSPDVAVVSNKTTESNSEDFNDVFLETIKKNLSDAKKTVHEEPVLDTSVLAKKDNSVLGSGQVAKKCFKRIRTPNESDSDESSEHSKKSKNNSYQSKLLYRDDIDICFHSSTSQIYSTKIDQSINMNVTESNKKVVDTITMNKSSEDTLLYLEQQYKNPIEIVKECAPNTNLDNLLSGIDVSAFENDFTVTNKNDDLHIQENQLNNKKKTELSASLFTETQLAKCDQNKLLNNSNISKCKSVVCHEEDTTIVEDSCGSDDMFEDDIVDTTPQKNVPLKTDNRSESKKINEKHKDQCLQPKALIVGKVNTNVTSMTPDILPLSNIDLNLGFFDNSKFISKVPSSQQIIDSSIQQLQLENNKFKPINMIHDDLLPLQLIKQQQNYVAKNNNVEGAKVQSSILSYITASSNTNNNSPKAMNSIDEMQLVSNSERCESPVLHARPSPVTISHPVICTSRLLGKENAEIMTFASRVNARYSNVFNKNVTHLIVKVDENNCVVDQTIKYVLAIAHGIWVVSYSWFKHSINKNRILPEELYEVLDMSGNPGPKLSRLRRNEFPIFKDFIFYIAEPVVSASRAELEDVIINLGGQVNSSPDELRKHAGKHYLILSEGKVCEDNDQYEIWKDKYKIMVVDIEWLSETVGQYEITSIRSYALCSDDNIESYGYPPELIASIPESQIQT